MKILHISGANGWGGNEQQLVDLIPELNKSGVENSVFGIKDSELHKACVASGISFVEAKCNKMNKFSNYKYLKTITKQHKPDLLHLHTSDSLTVFTVSDLLFNLKTKAVFSKKGIGASSSFLSKFKYNYKNVAAIICVSNAVKEAFSASTITQKNRHKLVTVYDGINLDRVKVGQEDVLEAPENKLIIGNIANHVAAKDLPTLIKAIDYLVNELETKNIHLLQIGKFHDRITPEIQKLVSDSGLQEYVTLAGFQKNASAFLPQFDLYAMSSQREGLPLTVYEAFLKKVPVVSTKAGGIPEAVKHGYNGYLAEVGDFKALAENIRNLLFDKDLQALFKERSYRLFFEKFTAEMSAKKTLEIYQLIIR